MTQLLKQICKQKQVHFIIWLFKNEHSKTFQQFQQKKISVLNKLNNNLNFINSKNKRIQSFVTPVIQDLEKELQRSYRVVIEL